MEYIKPNIKIYNSIEKLIESPGDDYFYFDKIEFNKIYELKHFFVVSEPGFGKSRCLKELTSHYHNNGSEGVFIDLKKINSGQSIENYINNISTIFNIKNDIEKLKESFKTKKFSLINSKKNIICLDALDEVKSDNFSQIVSEIKKFISEFNNTKICISCRKNHIINWKSWFSDFKFDYVKINLFDYEQTINYFKLADVKDDVAKEIIDNVKIGDRYSIVQIPRYLEILLEISKGDNLLKLTKLSKGKLFEIFIDRKIDLEVEKLEARESKKELIKNVLGKLALIMEIYQTNSITKDELMIFLDNIKSNLSIGLSSQISLDDLYTKTIIRDNIDEIAFENTEFQEYLSAKEILNLGQTDQVVFDLIFDKKAKEIQQSWINMLGFLVDVDISVLKNILEYLFKDSGGVNVENYHKLITKYNVDKLSLAERQSIFFNIFSYYQKTRHWLDLDICSKLSFYCDKRDLKTIFEYYDKAEDDNKVVKANSVLMIGELLNRGLLSDTLKNKWKKILITNINGNDKYEVLQRRSIIALGKFKDVKLLNSIKDNVFKTEKDSVINNIIYAYQEAGIENEDALACFIEGIKRNNISARYALRNIESKKNIKLLIKHLCDDKKLLKKFIEHKSTYKDLNKKLLDNIEAVLDSSLVKSIDNLIIIAFTGSHYSCYSRDSSFIIGLVNILDKKSNNYPLELLDKIAKIGETEKNNKYIYNFQKVFVEVLKQQQVSSFIDRLRKLKINDWLIIEILRKIKYSDRINANDVYEEGRKFFTNDYKKFDSIPVKISQDEKEAAYKEFLFDLEPEKGKYNTEVFRYYLDNRDGFKDLLKQPDKKKLIKLIKHVLTIDPGKQKLTINSRSDNGGLSYTTNSLIFSFGYCLRILKELKIPVDEYRQKMLNYIPFAYNEDIDVIFSLVSDPTEAELKKVLSIYKNKKLGDIKTFHPSSLIEASVHYNMVSALPILKGFVSNKLFSDYDRTKALLSIAELSTKKEKKYFTSLFDKNLKKNEWLSITANECLINKFGDKKSIKWRFKKLINRAFPYSKIYNNVHRIRPNEAEIDEKVFAKPIMNLNTNSFEKDFLDLLKKSFDIYQKGDKYLEYSGYLWDIVIQYYKNLKHYSSYRYLNNLEKFISSNSNLKGINWFSYKYQKLKLEYMLELGKPKNISVCIKKYNQIKNNFYSEVYNEKALFELIKNVINSDLRKWVEKDGAYKTIDLMTGKQEDLIQKTIKTQFENYLLKYLRDVDIKRESQLLDGQKIDFLISYGFYGPICLEIKLTSNNEAGSTNAIKKYRKNKLLKYVDGYKSKYGIFLVFNNVLSKDKFKDKMGQIRKVYKNDMNITIMGIDCGIIK